MKKYVCYKQDGEVVSSAMVDNDESSSLSIQLVPPAEYEEVEVDEKEYKKVTEKLRKKKKSKT